MDRTTGDQWKVYGKFPPRPEREPRDTFGTAHSFDIRMLRVSSMS